MPQSFGLLSTLTIISLDPPSAERSPSKSLCASSSWVSVSDMLLRARARRFWAVSAGWRLVGGPPIAPAATPSAACCAAQARHRPSVELWSPPSGLGQEAQPPAARQPTGSCRGSCRASGCARPAAERTEGARRSAGRRARWLRLPPLKWLSSPPPVVVAVPGGACHAQQSPLRPGGSTAQTTEGVPLEERAAPVSGPRLEAPHAGDVAKLRGDGADDAAEFVLGGDGFLRVAGSTGGAGGFVFQNSAFRPGGCGGQGRAVRGASEGRAAGRWSRANSSQTSSQTAVSSPVKPVVFDFDLRDDGQLCQLDGERAGQLGPLGGRAGFANEARAAARFCAAFAT
jgi:hypothetical protein